jgi:rubrerythrin
MFRGRLQVASRHKEGNVALDILKERGVPLDRQRFDWHDMVRSPISKLDADAFTRVRIILMNGIEVEAVRFQHAFARMCGELQRTLAEVRRVEQHQATLVSWLLPADQSPLETTIAYEQVAIEVTASLAQNEPDPYVAQVLRFGLLEDFDHLYRYTALLDRLSGKDANAILQSHTDIRPGRPTAIEHRAPADDVREPYDRTSAKPLTKLNALTIMAGEQQTHNYYMNVGPLFADPVARQLYAEIASIEEQHVTQYESIIDPTETWLEKWMLHEAAEVYNYYSCLETESDGRIKALWQRFLDYELGHLHLVMELFSRQEKRDPAEVLPRELPDPIRYEGHRDYIRRVLAEEVSMMAVGTRFVNPSEGSAASIAFRDQLNAKGCPSEIVAAGYQWRPGTELSAPEPPLGSPLKEARAA